MESSFSREDIIGDNYLVLDVRHGGMSEVYLCFDLSPMELVCRALKRVNRAGEHDRRAMEMLREEAAVWVALGEHENIVRCYVVVDVDRLLYLVLDWVSDDRGITRSVREHVASTSLTIGQAADVGLQICRGLVHCAEQVEGFCHGDLKPENLLLSAGGSIKITDFGLTLANYHLVQRQSGGQALCGTPPYMAPELWLGGEPSQATDIYAIGCLLYELVERRSPLERETVADMREAHMNQVPLPGSVMPERLWEIVRACLAKDPGNRPASYAALRDALEASGLCGSTRAGGRADGTLEMTATEWGNRALSLLQAGHYEEALEAFDRALELDPELSRAYNNRGLLFERMDRLEEALRDFDQALALDPDFVEVYSNRATIRDEMGQRELALEDAARAVALAPDWPTGLRTHAELLFRAGDYAGALELVQRVCAKADSPEDRCREAELMARAGRYADAGERFAAMRNELLADPGPTDPFLGVRVSIGDALCRADSDGAGEVVEDLDRVALGQGAALQIGLVFLHSYRLSLLALRYLAFARNQAQGQEDAALEQQLRKAIELSLHGDGGPRDPLSRYIGGFRSWTADPGALVDDLTSHVGAVEREVLERALDDLADPGVSPSELEPFAQSLGFVEAIRSTVLPAVEQRAMVSLMLRLEILERHLTGRT